MASADQHVYHTRATSVPSIATTPASPKELESGSFEWSNRVDDDGDKCSPWFGTGRRRAGIEKERPRLKVLIQPHTTPLPSTPTFSTFTDDPTTLTPPCVVLTPASPPPTPTPVRTTPTPNLPQSLSSPSLTTLLSAVFSSGAKPKRSSSSTSLADQQKQSYLLHSPRSPAAKRERTHKLRQSMDATGVGMELLPLHSHAGERRVNTRGERAIERLGRALGVMVLMIGVMVLLRVAGDVWVARMQDGFEGLRL